ncbi:sulfatase family protein [Cerasicoccus frondis]|uniref:sulfatase family protein n=1 Tax=Cerasicoccus frondis TaxID=490090 RepID=UPI002852CBDD|nr:sulfatase [Cerasicoccus frondis]
MNILYLHAHDAGRYVQPYGFPLETPNLMDFARSSVLFRNAFCIAPTCGPSRAALTSGQYPHQIGMYGLPGNQGWKFDDYNKHLANQFNKWGYQTVLCGVQHEANHSEHFPEIEYERVLEREEPVRLQDGEWYEDSMDKLERFLATRDDERPFFLSVGIDEPHRDNLSRPEMNLFGKSDRFTKTRYYDPDRLDWRYTAPPPWLPDLPEIRKDMRSYQEGVRIMDEYIGRVLYALKHNGLDDNTLVIITSDHGIEFPGGKKTLTDQGLQVMLMIRGPKGTPFVGGKVVQPMVTHLDLYPTICELLGKTPGHKLEGLSLLPLVNEEVDYLHEYTFGEQTYHGLLEPLRSIRTERYKYVRRYFSTGPQMRHDGPATTPIMEEAGWYDRDLGHEELFDLHLDPWEACNRINDPLYLSIKTKLSARLDEWMIETNDPFIDGKFPDALSSESNS